jgi:hypothetical protein
MLSCLCRSGTTNREVRPSDTDGFERPFVGRHPGEGCGAPFLGNGRRSAKRPP